MSGDNHLLILTYWSYPDALIQTYTLPYVRIIKRNLPPGSKVYLLTLEKDSQVLTMPIRNEIASTLLKEGIYWLPFAYRSFGIVAFFSWVWISLKLIRLILKYKVSVIHCWCTPSGAIGYLLSFILNRKLVLDSYEPHAETMVENATWKKNSLAFRLLFWLERKQTQRATHVISATKGMHEYAERKYRVNIESFFVKPACVNLDLFNDKVIKDIDLLRQLGLESKIVCVYAGKLGGIYLEDEIFDFIAVANNYWGDDFRFLILTNHTEEEIRVYCERAKIDFKKVVLRYVLHSDVPRFMGLADFAVTPVKPVDTKRYCTPIKNGEYWALGLPVVIPANISDDSEIIERSNAGAILRKFNSDSYQAAIQRIDELLKQPGIREKIRNLAKQYRSFEIAEGVYQEVYGQEVG